MPLGDVVTPNPTTTPSSISPTAIPTNPPTPTPSDLIPPSVTITYPANGAYVNRNATITIQATANDNIGVTQVKFYVSGSLRCTDIVAPYTCSWKVTGKPGSSYILQSAAYDAANNSSSTSIRVTSR